MLAGRAFLTFGAAATAAGGAIAYGLTSAITHFTKVGSSLDDMSQRTGVAVEMLSRLDWAAQRGGTSLEAIERALVHMARVGLDPNTFTDVGREIAAIEDPVLRIQRAMDVFGKSAADLLPVFADIDRFLDEARELGFEVSAEDARAASRLENAWEVMTKSLTTAAFQVGAALAPVLTEVLDTIRPIITETVNWITKNRELALWIAGTAAVLIGVGAAATAIGVALTGAVMFAGALSAAIAAIATPVGAVVAAVVLIGGAIAAAVVSWLVFTDHGQKTFAIFSRGIRTILRELSNMFGPALKALRSGEIELAWKIVVEGIKSIWFSAIEQMLKKIKELSRAMIDSGLLGPAIKMPGPNLLDEAIRGANLDMQLASANLKRLHGEAGRLPDPSDPSSPGYGKQGLAEMRAAVLGFSAQATVLAGNVIGAGPTPEDKLLAEMKRNADSGRRSEGYLRQLIRAVERQRESRGRFR